MFPRLGPLFSLLVCATSLAQADQLGWIVSVTGDVLVPSASPPINERFTSNSGAYPTIGSIADSAFFEDTSYRPVTDLTASYAIVPTNSAPGLLRGWVQASAAVDGSPVASAAANISENIEWLDTVILAAPGISTG